MRKFKPTHTATMVGNDARTPNDFRCKLKLRATKTMLISENRKFRIDGRGLGNWPLYRLIDIKPIEQPMTTDNRETQRAAIDAAIQPKANRNVNVLIPVDISDELKRRAKEKERFFRPYIASLLLLGMKAEQKGEES